MKRRAAGMLGVIGEPPVPVAMAPSPACLGSGALFDLGAIPPGEPLGVHLLIGLYDERESARADEIARCLASNLAHPDVAAVHVFDETRGGLSAPFHPKMVVVPAGERVTYGRFFRYANEALPGELVVVANSDIFFDESLSLLRGYPMDGVMLACTRWDEQPDGTTRMWTNPGSQDSWFVKAPVPARLTQAEFYLGKIACDNRIAWEAAAAGLDVRNPVLDLRTRHLHLSGVRRYSWSDAVPGPRLDVPLGRL